MHLDLIDQHTAAIDELTERIEVVIEPFRGFRDLICTIPGIGTLTAEVIIAETGADMTRFPTAGHLASWAGCAPGTTSPPAGSSQTDTRPGQPLPARGARRRGDDLRQNQGTYLGARYRRIAARRGPQKANVAIQHAMLVAIWNMGPTAPSTTTPEPTTSPDSNPTGPRTAPSTNSKQSATTSPSARQLTRTVQGIFASEAVFREEDGLSCNIRATRRPERWLAPRRPGLLRRLTESVLSLGRAIPGTGNKVTAIVDIVVRRCRRSSSPP